MALLIIWSFSLKAQTGTLSLKIDRVDSVYYGKNVHAPASRIILEIDPDSEPLISAPQVRKWIIDGLLKFEGMTLPEPEFITIGRGGGENSGYVLIPLVVEPSDHTPTGTFELDTSTGFKLQKKHEIPILEGMAVFVAMEITRLPPYSSRPRINADKRPYLIQFDRYDETATFGVTSRVVFISEDSYVTKDVLNELRLLFKYDHIVIDGVGIENRAIVLNEFPGEVEQYYLSIPLQSFRNYDRSTKFKDTSEHNQLFELPENVSIKPGTTSVFRVSFN
jgi:hypothetical protein